MTYTVPDPLSQQMRCGVFTNALGQVFLVHDQGIPSSIEWAEYDKSEGKLFLIHEDGILQDLGIEVSEKMSDNLLHGLEITLAKLENGTFDSIHTVTLIVKDYCE